MNLNFEGLLTEDYELFLPEPAFSKEQIALTLSKDEVYSDVIRIVNKGEGIFNAFVECIGIGIKVDTEEVTGNDIMLTYHLDTSVMAKMHFYKPALLLTYLGGEKVIEFDVQIMDMTVNEPDEVIKMPKALEPEKSVKTSSYSIQLNKKAYDPDDEVSIRIMNHDIYPIKVQVTDVDKELDVDNTFLSVTDKGLIALRLKKNLFERLFSRRKALNEPEVTYSLTMTVTTDEEIKEIVIPIVFTNYLVPVAYGRIKDDRAYRAMTVKISKLYMKYLLHRKKAYLRECVGLLEESMAYHPTDQELRLFYLIVMMDMGAYEAVAQQVDQLLQYSDFYEEQGQNEFTDIIEALSRHLNGESVEHQIKHWPMTTYRQMFKYHLFESRKKRFKDYEALYIAGVRSTFLYAETVYHLNDFPEIPAKNSAYYRFLIRWAITKGEMGEGWLKKLENGYYQVQRYHHLTSELCFSMYSMMSGSGMLKLLCMTLMDENITSSKACSVYYEVLSQHIYIKDTATYYIRSAYVNRLAIDTEFIQISTVEGKLNHDELAYLYTQYVGKRLNDGTSVSLFRRYYDAFLKTCIKEQPSYDERLLVGESLKELFERHQWKEIKAMLSVPMLSKLTLEFEELIIAIANDRISVLDIEWLESQLGGVVIYKLLTEEHQKTYLNYLINKTRHEELMMFYRDGILSNISDKNLVTLAVILSEVYPFFSRQMAKSLYDKGVRNKEVLELLVTSAPATLKDMLELYREADKIDYYNKAFVEKILYRAVIVRRHQEELLSIYLHYRNENDDQHVVEVMNRFFAAQILIEEMSGTRGLAKLYEKDLHGREDDRSIGLALLKMYQQLQLKSDVIAENILKRSIKNGIIFPWFGELAVPYIQSSQFRKVAFFSYHTKSYVNVTMYCLFDDEEAYIPVKMKHVAFGMYIGYVIAFYQDNISYYIQEESVDGTKAITESGIYVHEQFIEPEDENNGFDTVNTVIMSQLVDDDDSIKTAMNHYIKLRKAIHETMEIL